jgi:putative thioredoxin
MAVTPNIFDVDQAAFEQRVIERSRELSVVVDFWAAWCAPCKVLGPVLERAVAGRAGKVELAKLDVDRNPALSARFGIRGIPAVKAFRDGRVVAEFTGALPPPEVERFLDELVPSEAEELAARSAEVGDEAGLRRALELEPHNVQAKRALARILLGRGEAAQALELLEPAGGDFLAEGLAARARLSADEELQPAFEAWDEGDQARALELLQDALIADGNPDRRDLLRRVLVGIFTDLGPEHPLAREHRRRLAATLN